MISSGTRPLLARRALPPPPLPRARRPPPRAVAIQQPDVRRRRSNRREGLGRELGELRAGSDTPSPQHASHPPFGGSDGGRLRSCLSVRDPRGPRTTDTHAEALERHRARGSRAVERARSRPLAHVSRDEIARAPRGRPVAGAASPSSGNAGAGPTRGTAPLLRPGLDSRELPWPSPGGPRRGHRRIHGASGLSSRDRAGAHSPHEPGSRDRGADGARLQRLRSPSRARAAGLGGDGSRKRRNRCRMSGMSRSTFRSKRWWGDTSIPRTGCSRSGPMGTSSRCSFGLFVSRWCIRANGGFSAWNPLSTGPRRSSVRFSRPEAGEPLKLFVPLNFDEGDPVEVFTRVR